MTFNLGDRVRWVHGAIEADEVHGEVTEVIISYRVKWDNGEAEDLVREES